MGGSAGRRPPKKPGRLIFKSDPFSIEFLRVSHFYYRRAANRRYGRGKYSEAIEIVLMPSALTSSAVTGESDTAVGRWLGRWYFTAIGLVMIVVAVAGFAPSIIDPSERLAPLTPLVAVHGILLFSWLLLFLLQTVLIGSRRVAFHRRMGTVAVVLLTMLVPLSYLVTLQMVERGFDLSGDQGGKTDPLFGSIFNFVGLIEFLVLAGVALAYRRRNEIHKRFMLFANISLMGAPSCEH